MEYVVFDKGPCEIPPQDMPYGNIIIYPYSERGFNFIVGEVREDGDVILLGWFCYKELAIRFAKCLTEKEST